MTDEIERLRLGLRADASDADFMRVALAAARLSARQGEVPVGAVLVQRTSVSAAAGSLVGDHAAVDGAQTLRWLACSHNQPIAHQDPTAHAEMLALRHGARVLGNYRLDDCELFVTLEPCAMCAQAMLHSRLRRVVWGAPEPKTGAAGSVLDLFAFPQLNHHTEVVGGVLAEECGALLRDFFADRREAHKRESIPLRDDALRTPSARFHAAHQRWPQVGAAVHLVRDLSGLGGLCMHTIDLGPANASTVWLALHGPDAWWPQWANWAAQRAAQGERVLLPDLVGFGESDKPKKSAWHTPARHVTVLLEWLDALGLEQVRLAVAPGQETLAAALQIAGAPRVRDCTVVADLPALDAELASAPFPDAGHRAAQRTWPGQ